MNTFSISSEEKIDKPVGTFGYKKGTITRNIFLSYEFKETNNPTIRYGKHLDKCYAFKDQYFKFIWFADITIISDLKVRGSWDEIKAWLGKHLESIGMQVALIGAIIFLLGVLADLSIIGLPVGLTANTTGAVLMAIGALVGGIGYLFKNNVTDITIDLTNSFKDNGSEDFIYSTWSEIECDPNKVYDSVDKPEKGPPLLEVKHKIVSELIGHLKTKVFEK